MNKLGESIFNKKKLKEMMNLRIKSISIHTIPLSFEIISVIKNFAKIFFQPIWPSILSPTLSHIAVQLNLENDKDILIMEYGPYSPEDSAINNKLSNFSQIIDPSNNHSKKIDKNKYIYINKDGARIKKIDNKYFKNGNPIYESRDNISKIVSKIIATDYFGISMEELKENIISNFFEFISIDCDIKNKIFLKDLYEKFKDKKWESKKYDPINHNCQDFATEIIKILEAIRINLKDKLRINETYFLPNCIISALWDNEQLSLINTIGRIPFIGLYFDLLYKIFSLNFFK